MKSRKNHSSIFDEIFLSVWFRAVDPYRCCWP